MTLEIRRLTPELAPDYFDFFDNRAFSDGSPYYPCYCNAFYMTAEQIKAEFLDRAEENGGGEEGLRLSMRSAACRMAAEGVLQGYLAYDQGLAVGWCHANDKNRFVRVGEYDPTRKESGLYVQAGGDERIKSVVCFEIAPEWRGRGIAAALLDRVCADAREDGYDFVEAYPVARDERHPLDFTGPVRLYERAGFARAGQAGNTLIMRKALRQRHEGPAHAG